MGYFIWRVINIETYWLDLENVFLWREEINEEQEENNSSMLSGFDFIINNNGKCSNRNR